MRYLTLIMLCTFGFSAVAQDELPDHPPPPPGHEDGKGPPPPHGFPPGMDANGDGAVTRDEMRAFEDKHFDDMDANHDGKVTKEEATAFHKAMHDTMRRKMEQEKQD